MKKLLIPVFLTALIGCSESDQFSAEEFEPSDGSDDMDTLIATNERLVDQLGKYSEKNEELKEELESLEEENDKLKNDIMTYRTQFHQARDEKDEELDLRFELDELAGSFFEAVFSRDTARLEELTTDQIEVDDESEVLTVTYDNQLETTLRYDTLEFSQIDFLRLHSAEFDRQNSRYTAQYTFTFFRDNKGDTEPENRMIEIVFQKEDDVLNEEWRIASIQNRYPG
ncbi:hypothetical protein CR205_01935 [Alteribacter lacisalsi]|uniref:Uncharacterized protein n=1 Tax=Alteribacter lacisalsi TaxID=2045244 RepID=A0A2W0H9E1_9BACI|nr:hypothetical protein [Alteribacter lacisalsi]PYZ97386.1 hypothetical protein CR205_01935 [Alteribacter lacisalsi]